MSSTEKGLAVEGVSRIDEVQEYARLYVHYRRDPNVFNSVSYVMLAPIKRASVLGHFSPE